MNSPLDLINDPIVMRFAQLFLWILAIVLFIGFLRRTLKKRIENVSVRYKAQKGVEIIGYVLISLLILMAFTVENIKDYTIIIGLFTAGITFTLQELILSIAGSFYIFFVKVYKPGDRIEINGIKGDVIDIDSIYTTLMEIGEWVSSDNYSGRIVKISNAFVFKGPIKNYSMDFPFVWDELNIFITYDSDVALAKELVLEKATDYLSEYTKKSLAKWEEMVEHYYIENAKIAPTLAISPTDNWITINLRYITDYKLRRITKHELFQQIIQALVATDDKVKLASTTLQLLKIPELDINLKH
ncbi:mechanosensitive ion channel family protein [Arenibacter sp. M-2]|uniref:mechanosensitive ion channel family protein n=1 Tax=Arenibacter sp. M-2 TaxID=3053612 RepID=UPI00256FAAA1|nr:mechanosensitive ion channel family protein [Arenibacter sp. M-2]MDL5512411.1 mechanosensitive ion channel family protein [Arenibacter sp. M-2]|tara:strand:- start:31436 stop:32335 length:900 start_codon:yes stop_codon:yes gene_type:complete